MSGAEIWESRALGLLVRRDDSGSTTEVGRAHVEAAKGANGGPPHIHLLQEERFIVHMGVLLVRRGRERLHVGAGEDVRIPPRVVHTFKTEAQTTYTVEFRPPLRVWEFFRDLFALPTDRRRFEFFACGSTMPPVAPDCTKWLQATFDAGSSASGDCMGLDAVALLKPPGTRSHRLCSMLSFWAWVWAPLSAPQGAGVGGHH